MESGRINRINLQIANLGLGLKFGRKFPFPRIRRNLVFVFLAQPTKYIGVGRIGRRLGTLNVQTVFVHHPATMLRRIRVTIVKPPLRANGLFVIAGVDQLRAFIAPCSAGINDAADAFVFLLQNGKKVEIIIVQ